MSSPGLSSLATIKRYLASDICPCPRIALAEVKQFLRPTDLVA